MKDATEKTLDTIATLQRAGIPLDSPEETDKPAARVMEKTLPDGLRQTFVEVCAGACKIFKDGKIGPFTADACAEILCEVGFNAVVSQSNSNVVIVNLNGA